MKRPPLRAPLDTWRAFAVEQGMSKRQAAHALKKDLVAQYAQPAAEEQPTHTVATDDNDHRGDVEKSTAQDLREAGVLNTALGRSALKIARHVDTAISGAEVAAAGRELRMTLATAYSLAKPLSPPSPSRSGDGDDDEDDVLIGQERLAAARKAAEDAQGKRRRTRAR